MFDYTFHWGPALAAWPRLLSGAWVTLELTVLSMLIGTACGVLLAVFKVEGPAPLRWFANTWIEVARNTPALFQVYMIYFGAGSFGVFIDSFPALLIGISFNNAGYLAETFRGALRAIPPTQTRAARSLGFGPAGAFVYVVLPQMMRISFPPMTNQMVWAMLMTSLGVVVGLNTDITGIVQDLNVRTFRTFEFFAIAAVMYYVIAKAITVTARLISWRLFRY